MNINSVKQTDKKLIFISGANIFNDGPLTVYKDCLRELLEFIKGKEFKVFAIINNIKYFKDISDDSLEFIEIQNANKSYFHKIYYEYYYYNKLSKLYDIYFWLSINDVSPSLNIKNRAVYCHNASILYKPRLKDFIFQPKIILFKYTYWLIFRLNLNKNKFVIVQQHWFKKEFIKLFGLPNEKILVNSPDRLIKPRELELNLSTKQLKTFIFPSLPRAFKNFEIICQASNILIKKGITSFQVYMTIDGTENSYSKWLFKRFSSIEQLKFIGYQDSEKLEHYYSISDCLLFPSKLETWGLPITEFKSYQKPIFVSDLLYAYEVIGDYQFAKYFNTNNPEDLALIMQKLILEEQIEFDCHLDTIQSVTGPTYSWKTMFQRILID